VGGGGKSRCGGRGEARCRCSDISPWLQQRHSYVSVPAQMKHEADTAPALTPGVAFAIRAASCSGVAAGEVACTTKASCNTGKAVHMNTQNKSTSSAICLGLGSSRDGCRLEWEFAESTE